MEAAVAEKEEARMAEGNDERLDEISNNVGYLSGRVDEMSKRIDDLTERVDKGFTQIDARFAQVDARFAQIDARFDALQRTLLQLGGVIFAALLGLIATQI
jgi:flagellar capping protein FliD